MFRTQRRAGVIAFVLSASVAFAPICAARAQEGTAVPALGASALPAPGPATSGAVGAAAGAQDDDIRALVERATDRAQPLDARRAAVAELQGSTPPSAPALSRRLTDLRRTVGGGVATAMKASREQAGGEGGDLVEGFLHLAKGDLPAEKRAFSMLLMLRALAHTGTTPALRDVLGMTEAFDGAYRTEIGRLFKAAGEAGIPALLEARRAAPEVRRWAQAQLEGLGKKTAGDAAQVQSPQVLCDVLRAWGTTKDPEALSVVLTFVNSDRVHVRAAAREALAAYGQESIWKLREAYMNLTGKAAGEGWNAEQTAKELFLAYDRVRLTEVYELLEAGLKLGKEGKTDLAAESFDKVLAREPLLDRRREMVGVYMQIAESLADSDRAKALATYRKVLHLEPDVERRAAAESAVMTLDARELAATGVYDAELLRSAIAKDPANARARADLEGYELRTEVKREHGRRTGAAIGLLAAAIIGIGLFGRKRKARA